jgi:hypothetical protein
LKRDHEDDVRVGLTGMIVGRHSSATGASTIVGFSAKASA